MQSLRPPERLPNSPLRRSIRRPRGLCGLAAVAVLAALCGSFLLLAPPAAASPHNPVVVVLGVHQDGRPVARARSVVTQHLLHMGESVLAPALSNEDLLCSSPDCLQRLARAFRADRLVGGEVLPNDRNYIIRMWMLDVAQQQPSSAEERCVDCTLDQVYELSASGAGKLLDAAAVPPPPPPLPADGPAASAPAPSASVSSAPAPSVPISGVPVSDVPVSGVPVSGVPTEPPASAAQASAPPELAPTPPRAAGSELQPPAAPQGPDTASVPRRAARCTPRFYTFGRGVAVGALGGLTALGLGTAIGLTAADGSVYLPKSAEYPDDITWNFQAQYRAAYALTALTAAGLGAALINWRRLTGRAQEKTAMCELHRSKWTFNRGLAIGALGSLLASSLITSFALTALDGRSFVSDDPTRIATPIPYRFQTAYSVGYAASAGLALGLGLAVFLP